MTLRSVELQIALPRVTEASNVQNQMSQKPMTDQNALQQQQAQLSEQQMKRPNELDRSSTLLVGEEEEQREKGSGQQQSKEKRQTSQQRQDQPEHPYKGRHIDLML